MNTGYLLLGLITAVFWVSRSSDAWRRCILLGVVNAVFCSILMLPIVMDCIFDTPENLGYEVTWWMRLIGVIIFSSPIYMSLIVTPLFVATFMSGTNKIEKSLTQFINNNLEK